VVAKLSRLVAPGAYHPIGVEWLEPSASGRAFQIARDQDHHPSQGHVWGHERVTVPAALIRNFRRLNPCRARLFDSPAYCAIDLVCALRETLSCPTPPMSGIDPMANYDDPLGDMPVADTGDDAVLRAPFDLMCAMLAEATRTFHGRLTAEQDNARLRVADLQATLASRSASLERTLADQAELIAERDTRVRSLQRDLRQCGAKTAKLEPMIARQAAEFRATRRSVSWRITNRCDGSTCLG
jgi:hypothetical protein